MTPDGHVLYGGWATARAPHLLEAVRRSFTWPQGEDRATGYFCQDGQDWPAALAVAGPRLLADLHALLGVTFTVTAFQAYRAGAGCGWHTDTAFSAQAVLSLGVTRTLGLRPVPVTSERAWIPLTAGDLLFMPAGFQDQWEHCVPPEDVPGERCSLVFRTVNRAGC